MIPNVWKFEQARAFLLLFMQNKLTLAARLLMGLIFVVFGLNGFLNFIHELKYNVIQLINQ